VSVPVIRLGNTQVYLHVTFLASALVLALSGFGLHLLVFAGSLFFHEMGHALSASAMGAEVSRVEVWPFGAVGRLERSWQLTPSAETVVALAGPLNSGALCALASAVQRAVSRAQGAPATGQYPLLDLLIEVNLGLFLVNLIPCLPLDGGRVLRAQVALQVGYAAASRTVARWGLWAGSATTLAALAGTLAGRPWYPFLIAGPLIAWGAVDEKSGAGAHDILEILARSDRLAQRKAIPVQEIMVSQDATVSEVVRKLKPSRYHIILVAGRGMKVVGQVTETRVLESFYEGKTTSRMKELLERRKPP
jgi:stage IV sporulation protein FB